ncbi:MAG TPA: FecR family protein [Thermoanaerobaculia bacterium]
MRDDDRRPRGRFAPEDAEEAALRRLLAEAGPRPPLAEDDVERLAAATREALHRRAGPSAAPAAGEGPGAAGARSARLPTARAGRRWGGASNPRRAVWLPLAALLALALGIGAWWALSRGAGAAPVARVEAVRGTLTANATEGDSPLAAGAVVERGTRLCTTGGKSGARLRLAGGVELRLDGDTCVRAEAGERVALLRGGLYADTGAAGGSRGAALAVDTPFGTVRDVGTRFAVRLLAAGVAVAVREGAVLVGDGHRAEAGEGLLLGRDGTVERRAVPPWGPEWSWVVETAGGFAIEGRTLADFLDWSVRESGWHLRYADAGLAAEAEGIVLHGDLGALRPDEAPFVVLPGAGLEGRLDDGVLIVSRPARR